jgi:hypothetical protein
MPIAPAGVRRAAAVEDYSGVEVRGTSCKEISGSQVSVGVTRP